MGFLRSRVRVSVSRLGQLGLVGLVPALLALSPAAELHAQDRTEGLPEGFSDAVYASGLEQPSAMAFAPDGRLFVAERAGALRVIEDGDLLPTPFLTVEVTTSGERGLLGVAFDPDYERNRHVYIFYAQAEGNGRGTSYLSRVTASATDPDVAEPGSELVLLELPNNEYHNAGALEFGPDGMLYFSVGDNDTKDWVQSLDSLAGKVGRIDPSGYPDMIPPDNPFVGQAGVREEIWAYGFRNPFTLAVDPVTGRMMVNDVGDFGWEEVNELEKGENYGWPWCEGERVFTSARECPDDFERPVFSYPHAAPEDPEALWGCSVIGGDFVREGPFPDEYAGSYLFLDFCGRWIARVTPDGGVVPFARYSAPTPLTGLITGPDGNVYYSGFADGTIRRISYSPRLHADASAAPAQGEVPLVVTFSADGSTAPTGEAASFNWDFGDSTAAGREVTHTFTEPGRHVVELTVEGADGATVTDTAVVVAGDPLEVSVVSPDGMGPFAAGDTVRLGAQVSNGSAAPLPDEAFTWEADLHDGGEPQPAGEPLADERLVTFTVPPVSLGSDDAFYRIRLTGTDDMGRIDTATFDVPLVRVETSVSTEPSGLALVVDGERVQAPHAFATVASAPLVLTAPALQYAGTTFYRFTGWDGASNEGRRILVTPSESTEYVARYEVVGTENGPLEAYEGMVSWDDWSWNATLVQGLRSPAFGSTATMAASFDEPWTGLIKLHSDAGVDTGPYTHLEFALLPADIGFPRIRGALVDGNASSVEDGERVDVEQYAEPIGEGWFLVRIPLTDLRAEDIQATDFVLKESWGVKQPTFHLAQLRLVRLPAEEGAPEPPEVGEAVPVLAAVPASEVWTEPPSTPDPAGPSGQGGGSTVEPGVTPEPTATPGPDATPEPGATQPPEQGGSQVPGTDERSLPEGQGSAIGPSLLLLALAAAVIGGIVAVFMWGRRSKTRLR